MFNTLDSSPQECLEFKPHYYHTMCVCSFRNREHALYWIKKIVPQNKNKGFHKWSSKARGQRKVEIRKQFVKSVLANLNEIDFKVYCISSTESDISHIAQYFFSQNLSNITQEVQENGKNYLLFKITKNKTIKMPALRAARLIWTIECCRMLKSQFNLSGEILSDWFAFDSYDTADPAEGVSLVNFLLKATGVNLQISIPQKASNDVFELMSDWFSGWCRSSLEKTNHLFKEYKYLNDVAPEKFENLMLGPPYNLILYGQHCSHMEFNTTTNTLRIIF
ncbi:hypothetical protein [Legionella septentrionalis]|uniref:hypothetical protein n=1 Tax=Legionella septentrionalis TaxID=2498109 RepID=UPI000F8D5F8E|nr:hypothetical protein [Legionella septentrionalis]RUR12570.1 hypothetical protein ELY10_11460 [Legionella septentrionalis]